MNVCGGEYGENTTPNAIYLGSCNYLFYGVSSMAGAVLLTVDSDSTLVLAVHTVLV